MTSPRKWIQLLAVLVLLISGIGFLWSLRSEDGHSTSSSSLVVAPSTSATSPSSSSSLAPHRKEDPLHKGQVKMTNRNERAGNGEVRTPENQEEKEKRKTTKSKNKVQVDHRVRRHQTLQQLAKHIAERDHEDIQVHEFWERSFVRQTFNDEKLITEREESGPKGEKKEKVEEKQQKITDHASLQYIRSVMTPNYNMEEAIVASFLRDDDGSSASERNKKERPFLNYVEIPLVKPCSSEEWQPQSLLKKLGIQVKHCVFDASTASSRSKKNMPVVLSGGYFRIEPTGSSSAKTHRVLCPDHHLYPTMWSRLVSTFSASSKNNKNEPKMRTTDVEIKNDENASATQPSSSHNNIISRKISEDLLWQDYLILSQGAAFFRLILEDGPELVTGHNVHYPMACRYDILYFISPPTKRRRTSSSSSSMQGNVEEYSVNLKLVFKDYWGVNEAFHRTQHHYNKYLLGKGTKIRLSTAVVVPTSRNEKTEEKYHTHNSTTTAEDRHQQPQPLCFGRWVYANVISEKLKDLTQQPKLQGQEAGKVYSLEGGHMKLKFIPSAGGRKKQKKKKDSSSEETSDHVALQPYVFDHSGRWVRGGQYLFSLFSSPSTSLGNEEEKGKTEMVIQQETERSSSQRTKKGDSGHSDAALTDASCQSSNIHTTSFGHFSPLEHALKNADKIRECFLKKFRRSSPVNGGGNSPLLPLRILVTGDSQSRSVYWSLKNLLDYVFPNKNSSSSVLGSDEVTTSRSSSSSKSPHGGDHRQLEETNSHNANYFPEGIKVKQAESHYNDEIDLWYQWDNYLEHTLSYLLTSGRRGKTTSSTESIEHHQSESISSDSLLGVDVLIVGFGGHPASWGQWSFQRYWNEMKRIRANLCAFLLLDDENNNNNSSALRDGNHVIVDFEKRRRVIWYGAPAWPKIKNVDNFRATNARIGIMNAMAQHILSRYPCHRQKKKGGGTEKNEENPESRKASKKKRENEIQFLDFFELSHAMMKFSKDGSHYDGSVVMSTLAVNCVMDKLCGM